jgi:hypothetical protein
MLFVGDYGTARVLDPIGKTTVLVGTPYIDYYFILYSSIIIFFFFLLLFIEVMCHLNY